MWKRLNYITAGLLFFTGCTSNGDKHIVESKKETISNTKEVRVSIPMSRQDNFPHNVFKMNESSAENLLLKQKLVFYELEYRYRDTSLHNALVPMSGPTNEDPFYYFDMLKMLPGRGEALENFRVDANTGRITVRDRNIIDSDAWVSIKSLKKRHLE